MKKRIFIFSQSIAIYQEIERIFNLLIFSKFNYEIFYYGDNVFTYSLNKNLIGDYINFFMNFSDFYRELSENKGSVLILYDFFNIPKEISLNLYKCIFVMGYRFFNGNNFSYNSKIEIAGIGSLDLFYFYRGKEAIEYLKDNISNEINIIETIDYPPNIPLKVKSSMKYNYDVIVTLGRGLDLVRIFNIIKTFPNLRFLIIGRNHPSFLKENKYNKIIIEIINKFDNVEITDLIKSEDYLLSLISSKILLQIYKLPIKFDLTRIADARYCKMPILVNSIPCTKHLEGLIICSTNSDFIENIVSLTSKENYFNEIKFKLKYSDFKGIKYITYQILKLILRKYYI